MNGIKLKIISPRCLWLRDETAFYTLNSGINTENTFNEINIVIFQKFQVIYVFYHKTFKFIFYMEYFYNLIILKMGIGESVFFIP